MTGQLLVSWAAPPISPLLPLTVAWQPVAASVDSRQLMMQSKCTHAPVWPQRASGLGFAFLAHRHAPFHACGPSRLCTEWPCAVSLCSRHLFSPYACGSAAAASAQNQPSTTHGWMRFNMWGQAAAGPESAPVAKAMEWVAGSQAWGPGARHLCLQWVLACTVRVNCRWVLQRMHALGTRVAQLQDRLYACVCDCLGKQ